LEKIVCGLIIAKGDKMKALQELHQAIEQGLIFALDQQQKCRWYHWQRRAKYLGVIETLSVMDTICHDLMEKYSNDRGELN
jgi:hypothetical protein